MEQYEFLNEFVNEAINTEIALSRYDVSFKRINARDVLYISKDEEAIEKLYELLETFFDFVKGENY